MLIYLLRFSLPFFISIGLTPLDQQPVQEQVSEVSFQTDVKPILEVSCTIETCHDGSVYPALDTHAQVKMHAKRIRKRLDDRFAPMPPRYAEKKLTAEEKQTLIDWIAAGAKDN